MWLSLFSSIYLTLLPNSPCRSLYLSVKKLVEDVLSGCSLDPLWITT